MVFGTFDVDAVLRACASAAEGDGAGSRGHGGDEADGGPPVATGEGSSAARPEIQTGPGTRVGGAVGGACDALDLPARDLSRLSVVVHNDDVHTFDEVTSAFLRAGLSVGAAQALTRQIDAKGEAVIKVGLALPPAHTHARARPC